MYNYIPASSNVCKIIAFSRIIAGGTFSGAKQFLHFLSFWFILHVFADFETAKKSRAQNVQTETAKKNWKRRKLNSRR